MKNWMGKRERKAKQTQLLLDFIVVTANGRQREAKASRERLLAAGDSDAGKRRNTRCWTPHLVSSLKLAT